MKRGSAVIRFTVLVAIGVALDYLGSQLAFALHLPLYLDTIGTIAVAALGGTVPGIIVGVLANLIVAVSSPVTLYFACINILIAMLVASTTRRGAFRRIPATLQTALLLAIFCGFIGSTLSWALSGMDIGVGAPRPYAQALLQSTGWSTYACQLTADGGIELLDKFCSVILVFLALRWLPDRLTGLFPGGPLALFRNADDERARILLSDRHFHRGRSLATKTTAITTLMVTIVGTFCLATSYATYSSTMTARFESQGAAACRVATTQIDPDEVNVYLTGGVTTPGYQETQEQLRRIAGSMDDIVYLYVYQIRDDGCHVVFDTDSDPATVGTLGEALPFEKAFEKVLPTLLAGGEIAPIISKDAYGWLMTVYEPLYDSGGTCVAYVCSDIAMRNILNDRVAFIAKVASSLLAGALLIIVIVSTLVKRRLVRPINRLASATEGFAFSTEQARAYDRQLLREIEIHTGDELENLYSAVVKLTDDANDYIDDIATATDRIMQQYETIRQMQENTIMSFADLIDARDKLTGGHIRRTSAYIRVLARAALREGCYPDEIDQAFVEDVIRSAPLHDIGKIEISDVLLNKPGRFTDDEFELMKTHAVKGGEILRKVLKGMDGRDGRYLDIAVDMATYHHERWDGSGYPEGLSHDDIPLCARLMTIVDVFDALMSKRSYKERMDVDESLQIMENESGTTFDPTLLRVFLRCRGDLMRLSETFELQ